MSATREELAALIAQGASDAEAGRRFGISKSAVRRLRRRWGITALRNSRHRPGGAGDLRWGRGNLSERRIAKLYDGRRYDLARPRARTAGCAEAAWPGPVDGRRADG